uniref:Protein translocase subunit SecA n=1 Tax=Polysiphonia scopulorum TaxID=257860 RepID=A0A1Z1MI92_9FLOR|nr:preprotein-translocase subunit a [Polysiphonia scopulorum]ARW65535.1 preprotein-translocase subunit a [Polysiphonia scopulorum]
MFNLFPYNRINKHKSTIIKINKQYKTIKKYSDTELKEQTEKLQYKLKEMNFNASKVLIEAFATLKEAVFRSLGLTLFDVQLLGGIILNEGDISEMKTGEGKTLVALLAAYLNCLSGKGVHIVTVNDYLAERDANLAKTVLSYLNVNVGLITQNIPPNKRKQEYLCQITYITNSELGFDYLKDNMAISIKEVVQQNFNYAIIDEVDSILIDEARTPLIISGISKVENNFYEEAHEVAQYLEKNNDYKVDEKSKNIILTERGILNCEKLLKIQNLYEISSPWIKYILNGIKAKELFLNNRDYIVKNNQIVIVDEFTGRIMQGRRWSDGLHQAIEVKEQIKIEAENKTLASITYQNLFLLYPKLSGMTGTAKTEENEFINIYKMNVVTIPTNKKCIRKDLSDLVYKNEYNKWQAIANECLDMYKIGRPTLIGTTSIDKSELLSNMLTELNIPHQLLNAKPENITQEAQIISQAGKKNAITISTNMAGRGTDIILGGNPEEISKILMTKQIYNKNNVLNVILSEQEILGIKKQVQLIENIQSINQELKIDNSEFKKIYNKVLTYYQTVLKKDKKEVLELGGLYVIGTERHESRRIDNQLRGRSGRQGDQGTSRFFLSLQDNIFRIFGGSNIENLVSKLNIEESVPIESIILTKSLNSAQKKVESYFYDIRKQLFEYDEVINNQRKAIYNERRKILSSKFTKDCIIEYAEYTIQEMLQTYIKENQEEKILHRIIQLLNLKTNQNEVYKMNLLEIQSYLNEQLRISYELKEIYLEQLRPGLIRQLEKYYLLQQIDKAWQEHLDKMSLLKEYIGWRSYGQQDPLIEYKNEAFYLFINMITYIRQTVVYLLMRSRLVIDM